MIATRAEGWRRSRLRDCLCVHSPNLNQRGENDWGRVCERRRWRIQRTISECRGRNSASDSEAILFRAPQTDILHDRPHAHGGRCRNGSPDPSAKSAHTPAGAAVGGCKGIPPPPDGGPPPFKAREAMPAAHCASAPHHSNFAPHWNVNVGCGALRRTARVPHAQSDLPPAETRSVVERTEDACPYNAHRRFALGRETDVRCTPLPCRCGIVLGRENGRQIAAPTARFQTLHNAFLQKTPPSSKRLTAAILIPYSLS